MRREYTGWETAVSNIPYGVMLLLGAATISVGYGVSPWVLCAALGYIIYGLVGAVWIMIFMCPACAYYGTRECPCGYGIISAKLVKQQERGCFSKLFKKHIPVIVPIWFIPPLCGGIILYHRFTWPLFALVAAFAINSYVILPIVAKSHSCSDCPQRDDCPWMTK